MKKMLKRADGSTSQRGLWDNIRANKGSGKKPTKEMLKQEKKIKAESKQTGGDWMQGSNELKFGGITKYQAAGFDKSCISGDCNKMMAEVGQDQGGKGTGYEGTGASFNATKNRYNLNIVEKSQEQLDKEEAARNAARGKAEMKQAGRQMTRDENLALLREAQAKAEMKAKFAGASGVYANPRDLSPIRIEKTGGKRKYFKK
jgi:hypothetical protein